MEPEPLGLAQIGDGGQIVERADIDRARRADDQEGSGARRPISGNGGGEGRRIHGEAVIHRDQPERVAANAGHVQGIRHAAMGARRGIGGERGLTQPGLSAAGAEHGGPCHENGHEIRHGAARDEKATGRLGKSEGVRRPTDDLPLNLDRRVVAAAEIGVQTGRQHLCQHADSGAAPMHPAHEARMGIAGGERQDLLAETAVDRVQGPRLGCQRFPERGADVIRKRAPDRTIPLVADVIQHLVEHAMPNDSQRLPILGIEIGLGNRSWRGGRHPSLMRGARRPRKGLADAPADALAVPAKAPQLEASAAKILIDRPMIRRRFVFHGRRVAVEVSPLCRRAELSEGNDLRCRGRHLATRKHFTKHFSLPTSVVAAQL